jgi:hypothetical protein
LSAEKIALRLQGTSEYSNDTKEFLINCCDFHGCNNMKFYSGCHRLYKAGGIYDDYDYDNDDGNDDNDVDNYDDDNYFNDNYFNDNYDNEI